MAGEPRVTAAAPGQPVVLHDALFVPGAVRVPRSAAAPVVAASLRDTSPSPADGYHEGLRLGREEGLRIGHEEGTRAGYAEGLRQGGVAAQEASRIAIDAAVREATRPLEERTRSLDALLCGMTEAVRQAWAGAEDDIAALCYRVLCRTLGDAFLAPDALVAQVREALQGCDLSGAITLHLHPADARMLDASAEARLLKSGAGRPVCWIADPRVVLGGCIVAGEGGGLDARLETILQQCQAGLLEARGSRPPVSPQEDAP